MLSPGRGVRPLVGRVAQVRTLESGFETARAGASAALCVTGEPGIGKTRLLREAVSRAEALGFRVLGGRGTELERGIPYGVVIDAFDHALAALPPAELTGLGTEALAELARLLPSLSRWASPLATPLQAERHRCHRALRIALRQLTVHRPVLLVLDDVHWIDHASLEFVAHLLRHRVPRSALLLAHRARQLPDADASLLEPAVHDETLTVLELGPLTPAETAELLPGRTPAELAELHAECGGNPFYLQELARARARSDGSVPRGPRSPDASGVPPAVAAALEQEVRALSPAARLLLRSAAVAGGVFDVELAAAVSELGEDESRWAMDELVRSGLVQETRTPGRLTFRHPIVRLAIYQRAGYGWRRRAHRRAAAALARRGAALSVRAHHIEHYAEVGDELAIELLTAAGTSAAPRAPAAAARWYRAALRLLPDAAAGPRRLALSTALADALSATGHLGECAEVLREALALLPAGEHTDRVAVMTRIALTEQGLGNAAEGRRLLDAALALTTPGGLEDARLRLELARNHLMMRDWQRAAEVTAAVQRSAEVRGDRRLALVATAAGAYMGTMHCGQSLVDGKRYLDAATATLDGLSDTEVAPALLDGLTNVVYAEVSLERWENAAAHADRGIRLCRDTGHGRYLVELQHLRALALMMVGRLDRALKAADAAVETALLLDNSPIVALTEATRCWILMLLGRNTDALASGALAMRVNAQAPNALFAWHAPLVYGSALVEAGRCRQGRQELMKVAGGELLDAIFPTTMPHFYRFLVDAELGLGRVDAAERTTRRVESIVDAMPAMYMRLGDARYCRARVQSAREEKRAAAASAEQAVHAYEVSRTPVDAARARLLFGRTLADLGDIAAARREFDAAQMAAELCGAGRLTERARAALRRIEERGVGRGGGGRGAGGGSSAEGMGGADGARGGRGAGGTGGPDSARRASDTGGAGSARGGSGGSGASDTGDADNARGTSGAGGGSSADKARGTSGRGGTNGTDSAPGRLGGLTERQSEIIDLVVRGRTNRQISHELFVSEKTVEAHLTRLYTKLGVSSRAELAALAASERVRAAVSE
ncbi:helix-turn-helix transcriptional regulator [Nocardia blacklockiae]|uniref:helix-turn-helix transcriptional regulator n=1 Tax=Nocardia blacklockiae TaxID=480036 RepID=UPI0018930252|nr:LuxR family transcriptional regulator [Nocardia blacklockiae]MBF6169847.1 AAA family ATPase [Nocardia blacklockiae]